MDLLVAGGTLRCAQSPSILKTPSSSLLCMFQLFLQGWGRLAKRSEKAYFFAKIDFKDCDASEQAVKLNCSPTRLLANGVYDLRYKAQHVHQ